MNCRWEKHAQHLGQPSCGMVCRSPEHVVTPDIQTAAEQLRQLQQQLMHQQAELGAKRADVQVGNAALRCAVLCCAVLCCAVLCCAVLRCAALEPSLHQTASATLRLQVAVRGHCLRTKCRACAHRHVACVAGSKKQL